MPLPTVRERLAELKRQVKPEIRRVGRPPARRGQRKANSWRAIPLAIVKVAAIVAVPFVVLVRGSVYLYSHGVPTWIAIAFAAVATLCLVAGYAASISHRFTGRARLATMTKWVALPLMLGWCGYALFYLASVNAKTPDVRRTYTSLHPILRIALSTAILADADLVVTDMRRTPADYTRMGLPIFDRTLHYRQSDGWVHAVDLRTSGHGELRNRSLQLYFWTMGLRTLRHVGTADHLHVGLPVVK